MRVAKAAASAITRKHGTRFQYGSSAALLCKNKDLLSFNGHVIWSLFKHNNSPTSCPPNSLGIARMLYFLDGLPAISLSQYTTSTYRHRLHFGYSDPLNDLAISH